MALKAVAMTSRTKGMNRIVRHSGFTLLELVLVLAILVIVMALIAPSLQGFAAGRSGKNLATNLVAMTNYARTQAVAEGRTYRLNFDPSEHAFWLTYENGSTFDPPQNDFGRRVVVPDGVAIETTIAANTDGTYLNFYANGRTEPANIRVTDRFGAMIDVGCLSSTELFKVLAPGERVQ
jgi:prepilin-type N-terminal cleavage/methylation domain-containing protein